ncbi:Crp/Fnr family transcriptional regulator [Qipengyuania sp. MTN3-11]|uniref:Crp/Fnr family transcriptional regulator n=1 Tax=Qipengyuania sp. MTN3-11 TaxID=3056557 RepID=UPI0036F3293B
MTRDAEEHDGTGFANGLLDSLHSEDASRLRPLLSPIVCKGGQRLALTDTDSLVYFPQTMVACLSLRSFRTGVALVGREGMIGWSALLGPGNQEHEATVLLEGGTALTVPIGELKAACLASPTLFLSVLGFLQSHTLQMGRMIRACGRASLKQRVCAWLLMLHDRTDGNFIRITHDVLATHLAVRRASVTEVLHHLEGEHSVRCERSLLFVRDRGELELTAGKAYCGADALPRSTQMPDPERTLTVIPHIGSAAHPDLQPIMVGRR